MSQDQDKSNTQPPQGTMPTITSTPKITETPQIPETPQDNTPQDTAPLPVNSNPMQREAEELAGFEMLVDPNRISERPRKTKAELAMEINFVKEVVEVPYMPTNVAPSPQLSPAMERLVDQLSRAAAKSLEVQEKQGILFSMLAPALNSIATFVRKVEAFELNEIVKDAIQELSAPILSTFNRRSDAQWTVFKEFEHINQGKKMNAATAEMASQMASELCKDSL